MSAKAEKFSVVIPVYRAENYLMRISSPLNSSVVRAL